MINRQILVRLGVWQRLNRKQFNKLFIAIPYDRVGLYEQNKRLLTTEHITKALENEDREDSYIWVLYEENADKFTDEQIIQAIDNELHDNRNDIEYLFTNRFKAISDDVVDYACGLVNTLMGDDIGYMGSVIKSILITIRQCEAITEQQELRIIIAQKDLDKVIEDYTTENGETIKW